MVNHATKNNTVEITVAPYLAGTVNHATMGEMMKSTDYTRQMLTASWGEPEYMH